jgi:hypothetical protein
MHANGFTVGTTAVPNLANRGKRAGKSSPLSQILVLPEMGPCSGFTSMRVGMVSLSVVGGALVWLGGLVVSNGAELGSVVRGGCGSGTGGDDKVDELPSRGETT